MSDSRAALLVGAGDAIGAAVARRFAAGGYKVCIARRDASKAQPLVDELAAARQHVRAYSVDARKETQVQDLCEQVERGQSSAEMLCRHIQAREWELLFDFCYRQALGK